MRNALALLSLLLISACHDKSISIMPTAPSVVIPIAPVASCAPFDLRWGIAVSSDGPNLVASPDNPAVHLVQLEEQDGAGWRIYAGWVFGIDGLTLHFNHRYRIRGQVNSCWSNWHEFPVGPANPNASGEAPVPAPVPPVPPMPCDLQMTWNHHPHPCKGK